MSEFPFGFRPPGDDDSGGTGGGGGLPFGFGARIRPGGSWARCCSSSDGRCPRRRRPGELGAGAGHRPPGGRGRRGTAASPTPSGAASADAVRLAEVWLDPTTTLPAGTTSALAWSRSEWVEGTLPAWAKIVEPVAAKVVRRAAATALPEEMRAMAGPMLGMLQQLGGAMFGAQVGQGLGQLALEVVVRHRHRAAARAQGHRRAAAGRTSRRSARGWLSRRTTCGCTSRCARRPTTASIAPRAWLEARLLRRRRGVRARHQRRRQHGSRSCSAASTPATRRPSSRPCESGVFEPEDTPARRPRPWPGWRRCSPWSRAGSTSW